MRRSGSFRTWIRRLLCAVAVASGVLLLLRGVFGPFDFILPVHNALNPECALAVSILLLLLTGRPALDTPLAASAVVIWPVAMVALIAAVAYIPILSMPLISDDYTHIRQIRDGDAPTPLGCLTHPSGGPHFFRPVGFWTYQAEWKLWGVAALPRHVFDLILQVSISVLFLFLARRLGIPPPFDWMAALLFALNGIGPERVAWPADRFDSLALLFSLVAALGILRGSGWGIAVSMVATAAACMSKESAFVLPVLLALLTWPRLSSLHCLWRPGNSHTIPTQAGILVLPAAAVFVWRWIVLKGIGGYLEPNGAPTVLQFDALKLAKEFLWRVWGVLWFPVNWSRPLEIWMAVGLAAGILGSLALLRSGSRRGSLQLCAIAVAVACIPAHHMLLIGPDLERSRYLTYAEAAFVLLLAFACVGLPRRAGIAALLLMIVFHAAALQHNLRIWQSVSVARQALCGDLAGIAKVAPGAVAVGGLPLTVDGVYWQNGLEECLAVDFGIPMGWVRVNGSDPAGAPLRLRWDPATRALARAENGVK